jgi:hypothetical protein
VDLANVLLHDVEVVEEPLAGRRHVATRAGVIREADVGIVEDAPRGIEARQQRRARSAPALRADALGARDRERALSEPVGTERLAADRAREQFVSGWRQPWAEISEQWSEPQSTIEILLRGVARDRGAGHELTFGPGAP